MWRGSRVAAQAFQSSIVSPLLRKVNPPRLPENMREDSTSYIPGEKRKGDSVAFTHHQVNPQFISWDVGEKYSVQRILGKGSYGQVALAIDRFVNLTSYESFWDNFSWYIC